MKKKLLTLTAFLLCISAWSQKYCRPHVYRCPPDSVQQDIDTLTAKLDMFNNSVLHDLTAQFQACLKAGLTSGEENRGLLKLIHSARDTKIDGFVNSIRDTFFHQNQGPNPDSSYLFYYANYEINNYLNSLITLKSEMTSVITDDNTLSTINANNFFTTYSYMNQCRTALFARTSNIEQKLFLAKMKDSISKMQVSISGIHTLLDSSYQPLPDYTEETVLRSNRDRISSAADHTILQVNKAVRQNKKSIRTWGIVNGALIVLGTLLILLVKK